MFVFAIETCGKTVALIQEDNRLMLDGFLSGERDEGKILRRDIIQPLYWDGSSPFTARLATTAEELDYRHMSEGIDECNSESIWWFYGDFAIAACHAERDRLEPMPDRHG